VRTLQGHRREIYALEFSADGRTLVSASGDRTIRLWDMATILDPNTEPTHRVLVPPEGHNKSNVAFTSVAIAEYAGREYVAAGSLDGGVRVWDATPGGPCEVIQILREHEDSVYGVKFIFGLRSGLGIVSGSLDKTLKKWELVVSGENGETACVKTFKGHKVIELIFISIFLLMMSVTGCYTCYIRSARRPEL
jgi:general transcriptional corepressor TUP1